MADHGSFSAAARMLHMTPSAVSQQMATLEREVGLKLVTRSTGHGARLSAAGTTLAEHAAEILRRLSRAEAEMAALAARRTGRIRLGAFASVSATLLPPAVAGFRAAFPDLELETHVVDPVDAIPGLRADELDIAVITEVPGEGPEFDGIETYPVFDDVFSILLPITHRHAGRAEVALGEFCDEQWIVGSETGVCPDARVFRRACNEAGFSPRVAFRSEDYPSIQGLVAHGVGLSLIPALARTSLRDDVVAVPSSAPVPYRRVVVAVPGGAHDRTATVEGLLRALRWSAGRWSVDHGQTDRTGAPTQLRPAAGS